jgi:kynurenine formamidase
MRVAEAVGRALVGAGVDHVFGVVGSGNFHVTNAMVRAGARFVAARHEGGAATMADAYARNSGTAAALTSGAIEVIDLTAPLSGATPILQLPPELGQTSRFELEEISRYDDRGPAWYWNNFRTGEHTGTHFDAPNHWVTGKDGADIASVPVGKLIAPAVVLDFSDRVAADPDFLVEIDDIKAWEAEHGPLPDGGWLLVRTGWDARTTQESAINANETGPHSPGLSAECARWVAQESPVLGMGVETVGTDAGAAHSFDPAFPCHSYLMGSDKYGLTQLQNLASLPATGAVVIAGPLPIVTGSGSPARVLALVER